MRRLLADAGLGWKTSHVQVIRFGAAVLFLVYAYGSVLWRQEDLSLAPIFVTAVWLLGTSPVRFSPFGLFAHVRKTVAATRRDGEWIVFLRLYENNRRNHHRGLQFAAFCEQVAPYLPLLRHDLLLLSQRVTVSGLEKAFKWLEERFPSHHEVFAIVQTTERLGNAEAVRFLHENSRVLTKLSSDRYERRGKAVGQWLNLLNTLPSMTTFLMMLVLVLLYVTMIKNQVTP